MINLVEQSLQVKRENCRFYCSFIVFLFVFQHLRSGVFDVLPSTALDYLSAEDFRLLLNGTGNINVTTLMTYTTFNDESGTMKFC